MNQIAENGDGLGLVQGEFNGIAHAETHAEMVGAEDFKLGAVAGGFVPGPKCVFNGGAHINFVLQSIRLYISAFVQKNQIYFRGWF
jgi:hypothetical protein